MGNDITKTVGVDGREEHSVLEDASSWIGQEPQSLDGADVPDRPCAACGEDESCHWLLMTVDWEDYLAAKYDARAPEEESYIPLCSRCRSWAEMLEIAELNLGEYGRSEQAQILDERNQFLDSLRVEFITNFTICETLAGFE
jgi:hypothetical protein